MGKRLTLHVEHRYRAESEALRTAIHLLLRFSEEQRAEARVKESAEVGSRP